MDNDKPQPESIKEVEATTPGKKIKTSKKNLSAEQILKKKEVLEKVLKFGSNKERKDAMKEILTFPPEHSGELYKLMESAIESDNDNSIKIVSIRTLSEIGYVGEKKIYINSLKEKSDDVKDAGLSAIQKLKIEESAEEILSLLKSQDFTKNNNLITHAIGALGELDNGKIAYDFLNAKFNDKSTQTSIRAAIALYFGKVKEIKSEDTLIATALDESEEILLRSYAINSLGKINSTKSIPSLRNILTSINDTKSKTDIKKFAPLKIYCISALVSLGDSNILKDLVSYAKDDDPNVRMKAIKQLSEIPNPDKSVIELVEYKAQRDPNRKVQELAKKLLIEMKKKEPLEPKPEIQNTTNPGEKKDAPVNK